MQKNLKRRALLAAVIILSLFIPYQRVGSTQTVQQASEPAPAAVDEDALNKPSATSTLASDITKTIAILETGGTLDCSKKGLSGERGCHQFMPSTWRAYSLEVYGYVADQTPEAAEYVTLTKVERWLAAGYTPRQIFLIWNQGHAGQCKAGTNRHGVKYDSCAYADGALAMLAKFIPLP